MQLLVTLGKGVGVARLPSDVAWVVCHDQVCRCWMLFPQPLAHLTCTSPLAGTLCSQRTCDAGPEQRQCLALSSCGKERTWLKIRASAQICRRHTDALPSQEDMGPRVIKQRGSPQVAWGKAAKRIEELGSTSGDVPDSVT